jgi:hypothetical protein
MSGPLGTLILPTHEDGACSSKFAGECISHVCHCNDATGPRGMRGDSVEDELAPVNAHSFSPEKNCTLGDFVDNVYLPHLKEQKRASTYKGYRDMWQNDLKPHAAERWLREFRTCDAQRLLEDIAKHAPEPLSRTSLLHLKSFLSGIFARFTARVSGRG